MDLVIDATDIYDGFYEAPIKVLSNDPVNPALELPSTLTVTGTPEISLSVDTVLFDELYYVEGENFYATQQLVIANEGTKELTVDSVWLNEESEVFTVDKAGEFVIKPNEEVTVNVKFTPNAIGQFENTPVLLINIMCLENTQQMYIIMFRQ